MVAKKKNTPKRFYVGFDLTPSSFIPVIATDKEQAKEKFAKAKGVRMSSFIAVKTEKTMSERIRKLDPII